jgi:hypothetical protein
MKNELPIISKRHQAGCYAPSELADMLGIPHETFTYHVKKGYIPAPQAARWKRKYYSVETGLEIMEYFRSRQPYERQKDAGLAGPGPMIGDYPKTTI